VALIKKDIERVESDEVFRIEAYDIAHISGTNVVGVMTVVEDGEVSKSQYRKFKIKNDKNDDTNNLKEVLRRRFNHAEWKFPNLVVVDGGVGQLNAGRDALKETGLNIPVVSVLKDPRHKAREILGVHGISEEILGGGVPSRSDGVKGFSQLIPELQRAVLLANSESHRFAIRYHRKLRTKGFRI
jgi:excinuclease ABC subunit C